MCERLFAIVELATPPPPPTPIPPRIGLLMEDLESFGLRLAEYPPSSSRIGTSHGGPRNLESLDLRLAEYLPWIGTSHGGLRKFWSEAGRIPRPPRLELLMEDLESLGLRSAEYPPSQLCAVYVCVETSRCILHGCRLVVPSRECCCHFLGIESLRMHGNVHEKDDLDYFLQASESFSAVHYPILSAADHIVSVSGAGDWYVSILLCCNYSEKCLKK